MNDQMVIAVTPPHAAAARSRLLQALARAFPVRFSARDPLATAAGADAVVAFEPLPVTLRPPGIATIQFEGTTLCGAPSEIRFTTSQHLDRRLRGRTLRESTHPPRRLPPFDRGEILATRGSAPVWARRVLDTGGVLYVAAAPPDELDVDEPLKNRLRAGHFEGLLPLVDFLRTVTAERAWDPPPLRAMLMFDDPNLRWRTYGHIEYRNLLEHARRYNYHAAIGMIPIDARLVHPGAARLYRDHPEHLSVLLHGLTHVHRELVQPVPVAARERAVARALRRIDGFERRSGVIVSRVIVAPHGEASEQYLATLLRFGVEAVFADLPFPWRLGDLPRGPDLTFWHPVNFVAGSMPVIPRYPLTYDPDEVVLRAFLDHPLVLYGHHEDVADGLQTLERAAALVNGLGPVRWTCATGITRQNVLTRRRQAVLSVRPLARRIDLTIPAGVDTMEIDLSAVGGDLGDQELLVVGPSGAVPIPAARAVTVEAPAGHASIELRPIRGLHHWTAPAARLTPWPVLRRAVAETRDRLRPLLR